jgi:hypothetical protein
MAHSVIRSTGCVRFKMKGAAPTSTIHTETHTQHQQGTSQRICLDAAAAAAAAAAFT